MKKLLLAPALLATACGLDSRPDEDQLAVSAEGEPDETPDEPDQPLIAFFLTEPNDCADQSVRFEGHFGYSDVSLGSDEVENPICRYEVADGRVFDSCFAVIPLPLAQTVVFRVTDPATGQVATSEELVQGPAPFSATADVSSDGLTIRWDVHTNYGGLIDPEISNAQVLSIEPSENVIFDDTPANTFQRMNGSVRVSEPGTYTVSFNAFISFGDAFGCGAFLEKTIEVTCEGDTHNH